MNDVEGHKCPLSKDLILLRLISDNVNIADILHRTLESARATEHETGFTGHVATSLIMFDPVHLSKSHEGTLAPHFNILDVHFFLFC